MKIKPYVRVAMHDIWTKNHYMDRAIWDHEIIFIESGSMKFTIEGKVYIANENDLVLLRPRIHHIIEYHNGECSQPHVHFDFYKKEDSDRVRVSFIRDDQMTKNQKQMYREDFYKANNIDMPYVIHLKDPDSVKKILYKIINEFTIKNKYYEIILQGLMIEFIITILRDSSFLDDFEGKKELLYNITTFMNKNVDNNLTLEDFSKEFNISKWSLIQLFNEQLRITPLKYYNNLKHLRAKELLKYSFLSINEISQKMNYNEPQTFSRWFKDIDGNSPIFYRKDKE